MNDYPSPIHPFRWNIAERSELGSLIDQPEGELQRRLRAHVYSLGRLGYEVPVPGLTWLEGELRDCAARIIAFSSDSDLCFVGRSPESIFDYLAGLLRDTSWASRLSLLHFSMYGSIDEEDVRADNPAAIDHFRSYLAAQGLSPDRILHRQRSVCLVDIVARGRTLGNLVGLLYNWCLQSRGDWQSMRRKLRIVGLTERTETSPKTWRWQQHADWLDRLPPDAVKNVSVPAYLFHYLGAGQPKTTASYSPELWGNAAVMAPSYGKETLAAIRLAHWLFERGKLKPNRTRFAATLAQQPTMRESWFRALLQELNR